MTTATLPASLRDMTEDALLAVYRDGSDTDRDAVMAECRRRDRADRARKVRQAVAAEWRDAAYAQYLAADAECRGNLLSREGVAAGITAEMVLWTGPERWARRMASEELNAYWDAHPRLTVTEYRRQLADAARVARDDADLQQWDAELAETEPATVTEPAEWEALPDGGRVRPAVVTVDGQRQPAWWAVTPAGHASLHATRDAAVTAASPVPAAAPVRTAESHAQPPARRGRVTFHVPAPAGTYAAAVAVRKGSKVRVTDLGTFPSLPAAMAAVARSRQAAGRAITWQRRNLTTWGAALDGAGFSITCGTN